NELDKLQVELRSPPRVSLYQEAALAKRDSKRQIAAAALAPVLVVLLVCFGVAWWEHRARRIHSAEDIVGGLGMRVLRTIPLPSAPAGRVGRAAAPRPPRGRRCPPTASRRPWTASAPCCCATPASTAPAS